MSNFSESGSNVEKKSEPLHIDIQDLTFNYVGREPVLRGLNMQLTDGARCLLIGANGAGNF